MLYDKKKPSLKDKILAQAESLKEEKLVQEDKKVRGSGRASTKKLKGKKYGKK
jgi:hypothetical protein